MKVFVQGNLFLVKEQNAEEFTTCSARSIRNLSFTSVRLCDLRVRPSSVARFAVYM